MTTTPQPVSLPAKIEQGLSLPVERGTDAPTAWQDLRLRKHADYQKVYRATRKQFSTSMTWFLAPRSTSGSGERTASENPKTLSQETMRAPATAPRVGLTVGKILGKAHERNRIKRRMREVIRRHWHELPAEVDLILHPRRSVMMMDFVKLESEIVRIFRQAKSQITTRAKIPARVVQSENSSPPAAS